MSLAETHLTAAHGGFSGFSVPLGGGATISDWLVADWRRTCDLEIDLVTPSILGANARQRAQSNRFEIAAARMELILGF